MYIAVTSPSFSKNTVLSNELKSIFDNTRLNTEGKRFNQDELIYFLRDAHGAIIGLEEINETVLSACPRLKIIAKYGVGLDNIDIEVCKKRGIAIGWSGGVNRLSVAEMTLGYMLMLCRNLYVASNQLKIGTWNKSGGFELSGKKVGIIGVGNIGKEVVKLLQPFCCEILLNDIVDVSDFATQYETKIAHKEEIYESCDIITIHTQLTSETRDLLNLEVFKKIKRSAFVLNSARGGIINQDDLKFALKKGIISGAAIDVYDEEPPSDMELLALPNLICTPHIGGNSAEAVLAMGRSAINHLREFF